MNLFERVIQKLNEQMATYPISPFRYRDREFAEKDYCGTQLTTGNNREPIPTPAEPPVKPRVPVTVHAERTFTLSSGEVLRCCPVDGCLWGRPMGNRIRTKHSNGEFVITEIEEEVPEACEDDPTELTLDAPAIVAGADEPEDEEALIAAAVDASLEEKVDEDDTPDE